MGQGPLPRYLCPRLQVFQPPVLVVFFVAALLAFMSSWIKSLALKDKVV